jgi:hypothetical protein
VVELEILGGKVLNFSLSFLFDFFSFCFSSLGLTGGADALD